MKHVLFHIFSLLLCYLYFSSFQSGFENQKWLWAAIILAIPSQKTRFLSWGLTWRIVAFSSRHNLTPTVTNWFESCHRMYMLGVLLERMACLWQFSNSRHGRLCYSRHQHHPSCFPWSPGPGESGEKNTFTATRCGSCTRLRWEAAHQGKARISPHLVCFWSSELRETIPGGKNPLKHEGTSMNEMNKRETNTICPTPSCKPTGLS